MQIDIYFAINSVNKIKISKFLESINWRINHITKRAMKLPLVLQTDQIQILEGNVRSPNPPLLLQYSEKLLIEFACKLNNNSIQISVQLSNYLQTKLRDWVSESAWFPTLAEGQLWPETSKTLKDVNWPNFSVEIDMEDVLCYVSGVQRRSMCNQDGYFSIDETAQLVNWSLPQDFPSPSRTDPPPRSRSLGGGSGYAGVSSGSS